MSQDQLKAPYKEELKCFFQNFCMNKETYTVIYKSIWKSVCMIPYPKQEKPIRPKKF